MRSSFPFKRRSVAVAIMAASAGFAMPSLAQDNISEIEEVIVTGSFIRGTPEDAPSPVTIVNRDSIEASGASQIWDVIRNLEVNSGSDTSVSGSSDAGQLTGTAQVNLRNLGGNSTLTLINGKRMSPAAVVTSSGQEFVNINSIPLVMTDRVEVLTDGGSALYGADAVAGVVNIMMRTDFEGVELYGDIQGVAEASGDYDKTVSGIWGWASDSNDTHLVLSGEFFSRDPVNVTAANYYDANAGQFNAKVGALGTALALPGASINPNYIRRDLTDLNIAEDGNSTLVLQDPLCTTLSGPNGAFYIDNRYSDLGQNNATCQESDVDYNFIAVGAERTSLAGSFDHLFGDGTTEFYSFFSHSETETERVGDGTATSRSTHYYIPPPGTHSGPAAFATSLGELGAFAAAAGNTRPGPNDITNSPLDIRNDGLGTGMFGGVTRTGWPRTGNTDITRNDDSAIQAGLRGEFELANRVLDYDVSLSWSASSVEQEYRTLNRRNTELALQGLGGPNCTPNGISDFDYVSADFSGLVWPGLESNFNDIPFPGYILNLRETFSLALTSNNHGQGGCEFYNPFLTALTDPALANSPELIDWMQADVRRADKRNTMAVFDAVVSGELFDMGGGVAQFAAGAQYRETTRSSIAPEINYPGIPDAILNWNPDGSVNETTYISNNLECSGCIYNFDHERDVSSVFLELSLPFIDNVETQIALRYEDYGGSIGSEVSPKFAMSWRPVDDLLVRGSYSKSFRAPNIGVIEESFESFSTSVQDPISNQMVRAGLVPATNENAERETSFTRGAPNPALGNENADTYSLGFQWTPEGTLDGLSIGADVWRFEVSERVLPQVPRAALQPEIDQFNAVVGDPNNYVLNESIKPDAGVPYEACDPNALEAQFGRDSDERLECVVDPRLYRVDGVQRLLGDVNADLVTLVLPAINGGNIEVDGIDVKAAYNWDSDWGDFRVSLDFTHINTYKVSDIPGLDLGLKETGVFDAAGTDGDAPYVNSLPDNKGNLTFSWNRGDHRVTLINRHIGSYQVLDYQARLETTSPRLLPYLTSEIESYNTWDMQYNYTHAWSNIDLGTTVFTLGVIDAFNADLPMYRFQTFDRQVFDGRGSRWYARALWQF